MKQGPRLAVHCFTNFRAWFTGPDTAEATNYLFLYAANGVKVLPTHPPITISLATDRYRARWRDAGCAPTGVSSTCLKADAPITNPKLDDEPAK